jgi:hypothetical protein
MAGKTRCTAAEKQFRTMRFARMIANGATRSDLLQYGAQEWGLSSRMVDEYRSFAIKELEEDWNLDRQAYGAVLLSQLNIVHKKSMEGGNLAVTLGCINTAAKIAKLFD